MRKKSSNLKMNSLRCPIIICIVKFALSRKACFKSMKCNWVCLRVKTKFSKAALIWLKFSTKEKGFACKYERDSTLWSTKQTIPLGSFQFILRPVREKVKYLHDTFGQMMKYCIWNMGSEIKHNDKSAKQELWKLPATNKLNWNAFDAWKSPEFQLWNIFDRVKNMRIQLCK